MESVVARVKGVDVAVVVERGGRAPGLGWGEAKEGKQPCLGHASPFRVPGLDSVPQEFWSSS